MKQRKLSPMMAGTSERVTSLRRYISLLLQEQKRLQWLSASAKDCTLQRIAAETNLTTITGKLHGAERELFALESGRRGVA
jgi:hypothetical protein